MLRINLVSALLFTVFKKLLFRDWIWSRLESLLQANHAGFITCLVTTALFAIWQLGYTVP